MTIPDQESDARRAADFIRQSARQEQFLYVASRDEAEARFRSHLALAPLGDEIAPYLAQCRGRVLARDVAADGGCARLRSFQRRWVRRPRRRSGGRASRCAAKTEAESGGADAWPDASRNRHTPAPRRSSPPAA